MDEPKNKGGAPKGSSNRRGKAVNDVLRSMKSVAPREFKPLAEVTDADYQLLAVQVSERDEKAAKDVSWAAKYRFFHPADIDPKTVPSRTAVTLLQIAQKDPNKFIEQWSKLLPTRQQIDAQERFQDDGSNALERVLAVQAELEGSEGDRGESEVQEEDFGIGGVEQGSEAGNLDRLRA